MNFIYIYNYKINILNKIKFIIDFSVGSILKFSNQKSTKLTDITENQNRIVTSNPKTEPKKLKNNDFLDLDLILLISTSLRQRSYL